MSDLLDTPFVDRDTGKLVYLRHKQAYFATKQILSLNPLRFSQGVNPLEAKPQLGANIIGLKRQQVFNEQGNYLGRLGSWQFIDQGLLLASIIVFDTSLWRKIMGKVNPDLVVSRSQIRELTKRKIVVASEGQIAERDQAPYPVLNN